jgi:CRISPR/Cas system CSM-associated protein Csm3 (group 7 of RAMP superfamily)
VIDANHELVNLGYRCLITGRLTTKSFLHIGGEKPDPPDRGEEKKDAANPPNATNETQQNEKGTPSPVVIGSDGKVIIPASALRGALRSRLKRLDADFAEKLMGKGADESTDGRARRIFIQTATVEAITEGMSFDDEEKCVDKIAMTAMSRWRRAPQNKMLRTVEAVPPGVSFKVTIGICGDAANAGQVTGKDVSALLAALGHDFDAHAPLQLGAFQKAGWGSVEWKTCKITAMTEAGLKEWLDTKPVGNSGTQGWGLCTEPVDSAALKGPAAAPRRNIVYLPLTLEFKSTFFTDDQRDRVVKSAAKEEVTVAQVMRTADGRACLVGQSLKGAMRSQPERILHTKGIYCCDPTREELTESVTAGNGSLPTSTSLPKTESPEERRERERTVLHTGPRCLPIRSANDIGNRCVACQVFGAGGWASTIEVDSFIGKHPYEGETADNQTVREFLAISRFTGGGVKGLKFSSKVAIRPVLEGTISINLDRLSFVAPAKEGHVQQVSAEAKYGALLHLFRDFCEGDIPVGAGRSKGFGTYKVILRSAPSQVGVNAEGQQSEPPHEHPFESALIQVLKGCKPTAAPNAEVSNQAHGWLGALDELVRPIAGASVGKNRPTTFPAGTPCPNLPAWWLKLTAAGPPEGSSSAAVASDCEPDASSTGSFNPYHWVPAEAPSRKFLTSVESLEATLTHRHDVYAPDGISGEMTVRITPITPFFVGGRRISEATKSHPAEVAPYEVDKRPAIPSTTIRGLLSSVFEIATASAMRVLENDKIYSYRMAASSRFHLIGRVCDNGTAVRPWNQRPTGRQYRIGTGVPNQLSTLLGWEEISQTTPRGDGQNTPYYYCLDFGARHKHMPDGRNHEIQLRTPSQLPKPVRVSGKALDQFYRLADERTEETKAENQPLPYEPQGQRKGGRQGNDLRYRLKDDDFVYFEAGLGKDGEPEVVRLSLAQIWRDDVEKPLRKLVGDANLVPFGLGRANLTLAETAFGFVRLLNKEEKRRNAGKGDPVPAFASKIVLSDGLLAIDSVDFLTEGKETLKILSSPKPPSPAFYFGPVGSSKTSPGHCPTFDEIAEEKSRPRGRKMYLHLDPSAARSRPWRSVPPVGDADRMKKYDETQNQRVRVQCLSTANLFDFTISFDNLTEDEFLALCFTLQPCAGFHHKLGMGKPLGLGSIAMEVTQVQIVDRNGRYTQQGFDAPRLSSQILGAKQWVSQGAEQWSKKAANSSGALDALKIIGTSPVPTMQYPMTKWQTDKEFELFKWPSENRKVAVKSDGRDWAQFLIPVRTEQDRNPKDRIQRIMSLPWLCRVILIAASSAAIDEELKGLSKDLFKDAKAAGEFLSTAPKNTMYFIVGPKGPVPFHQRVVKQIEIPNMGDLKKEEKVLVKRLRDTLALCARS